jgi:diacylglycerol kinase family enzyme
MLHGCHSRGALRPDVLIYNSANPRVPTLAEGVQDDLRRRLPDMPATVQPTRCAGHARELAAAAAATGRPLIIVVSGDGVYNEVVNGIRISNCDFATTKATPIQIDGEVMHAGANSHVEIDSVPRALTTVG